MKLQRLILVLSIGIATSAFAGAGDGGCGIGSVLIGKNAKLHQLAAYAINYYSGGVSSSMTSGTSNCKVDGIVVKEKATIYFVETNQSELSNEIANGKGEKITALASMVGCSNAKEIFNVKMQKSYVKIYPKSETSAVEMLSNVNMVIKNDVTPFRAVSNS
jgi:hypothetical protein